MKCWIQYISPSAAGMSVSIFKYRIMHLSPCALLLAICLATTPVSADNQQTSASDEIIRGSSAQIDAQPWMVALVRNTTRTDLPVRHRQFCGGTLIDPEWVLTAAHCVIARSVSDMSLIIGESNLDASDNVITTIKQIVIHPHYDARSFANDIALLRLESPSSLMPLELYTNIFDTTLSGTTATVYGWGRTYVEDDKCDPVFFDSTTNPDGFECKIYDLDPGSRDLEDTLLQTDLVLLSDIACLVRINELREFLDIPRAATENTDDQIVSSQLCAYDPVEITGLCFGDSGGPLVVNIGGKKYHAGVTSLIYGVGGCQRRLATEIFTKTAVFLSFIDEVTRRSYELGFENFCPPQLEPQVEYVALANGNTEVRISWEPYALATHYTLRYSSYPDPDKQISSVQLNASLTEIHAEMAASASFYVAVQAASEFCSGPDSSLLVVQVPAL